jgi:hypothetical protein
LQAVHKLGRLKPVVENELTPRNAAGDVVGRTGNKQAGMREHLSFADGVAI